MIGLSQTMTALSPAGDRWTSGTAQRKAVMPRRRCTYAQTSPAKGPNLDSATGLRLLFSGIDNVIVPIVA